MSEHVNAALPTAEQLMEGMACALKAQDFEAAVALLRILEVVDPVSAETICETIEALPVRGLSARELGPLLDRSGTRKVEPG